MEEEVKYTSEFDGQTTDEVLKHAKSVKDLTIPSLSNISGFVCIDNEGKAIGMMSKEQVAQVVGGLIGIDNAIKIKGTLGVGTDLNSINTVGIFKMNGSYKNCPCAASWGCLIIPPATASSLPQILIEVTSTSFNIFARRDANYNWHKINMTKI